MALNLTQALSCFKGLSIRDRQCSRNAASCMYRLVFLTFKCMLLYCLEELLVLRLIAVNDSSSLCCKNEQIMAARSGLKLDDNLILEVSFVVEVIRLFLEVVCRK